MTAPASSRLRRPAYWAEEGTVTVWLLGMLVMVLALGGLSLDLWRAFDARRAVAGFADAAAIAGASGIDEAHLRQSGQVRLDPDQAQRRAAASLASHSESVDSADIAVAADRSSVTVTASRRLSLTLLRVLSPDLGPQTVTATATSAPRSSAP